MNETVKLEIVKSAGGACLYVDEKDPINPEPDRRQGRPRFGEDVHTSIVVPRAKLLEALGSPDDRTVMIGGETFEVDADTCRIRTTVLLGDAVKTVEMMFGDSDPVGLMGDVVDGPDGPVELKTEHVLIVGRIVRYVDEDGKTYPAIVTYVARDPVLRDVVNLHVFPERSASRPVIGVSRHDRRIAGTWHWPEEA